MQEQLKISVSGVRGVVGEALTLQVAQDFAAAFGLLVGPGRVLVGRDTRPHGARLEAAVREGLRRIGCQPVMAGVVATPTALMLTPALGLRGGVVVTASHNPADWNGLKFIEPNGLFLGAARLDQLVGLFRNRAFPRASPGPRVVERLLEPMGEHRRRILGYVNAEAVRKRRFRVALDTCNGVGALYAAAFLREDLGCEVFPVFDQPTGEFEREPEPLPERLGRLCEEVRLRGADVGFAQDPDGDRLAIVNERGEPIGEDLTLAFAVEAVLTRHARGPVVVTLSTSKVVDHVAATHGCEVVRTRIGELHVAEEMLRIGAPVGGESNGGVMVPAVHPCRDSFLGMALVLELLAATDKTVSQWQGTWPSFAVAKDKLAASPEQASRALAALRRAFEGLRVNLLDGIHVDWGNRWLHVRPSNTEPVIRIIAEAPSEAEARGLVAEARERILAAG